MSLELKPATAAGERFVAAAESIRPLLREAGQEADRSGSMSAESFEAVQASGIAAAFVPEALGGLGVESVTDWLAGITALGKGDGSVAIALTMQHGVTRGMAQAWRAAITRDEDDTRAAQPLRAIASGAMRICATATERGTDNLHPQTTAEQNEAGWLINGHKMFVTGSPLATHMAMNLRSRDADGDHLATTMIAMDTPGVEPQADWDALGMRGSGSQSIRLNNVQVPRSAVRRLGPWGRWSTASLISRTLGNLVLVGAFLGIAEHARELALRSLDSQRRLGELVRNSAGVQTTVGEMEIELATCQSVLQQTGERVDAWLAEAQRNTPDFAAAHNLMKDYQAAKWVVNRGAIRIVDHALNLAGGGGFMAGNPLTQLYRDVRAGPFMQPQAAVDIRNYVGQVALGLYPEA